MSYANKQSRIINRTTQTNKFRTATKYRDEGSKNFALSTDTKGRTSLFIDSPDGTSVRLNGNELRTIRRIFEKHVNSI